MIGLATNETGRVRVRVIGVGNAGGLMVKRVARERLAGVECGAINTALKDLEACPEVRALQIGVKVTHGTGSGSDPEVGCRAAQEDADKIRDFLGNNDVVFLLAGFGKGTGTGAAPVVAELARQAGALTVAFVTRPFDYEGSGRMRIAEEGMKEIEAKADVFIPLPNQRLLNVLPGQVSIETAFGYMDEAVVMAIRGIVDVLVRPGRINLDLADLRGLLKIAGKTAFGVGIGKGEGRLAEAVKGINEYPFFAEAQIKSTRGLLISISGGPDLGVKEVEEIVRQVSGIAAGEPNLAFGIHIDEALQGELRVMLLAAGLTVPAAPAGGDEQELRLFAEKREGAASELVYRPERWAPRPSRLPAELSGQSQAVDENTEVPAYLRRKGKNGSPAGRG